MSDAYARVAWFCSDGNTFPVKLFEQFLTEDGAKNPRELMKNMIILPSVAAGDMHEFKQMISSFSEDRVQLVVPEKIFEIWI